MIAPDRRTRAVQLPRQLRHAAFALVTALLLNGCLVGPKYVAPTAPTPPQFKEPLPPYKEEGPWRPAQPLDDQLKGDWWTVYHDPGLDALEPQIDTANQTLRQADANLQAAREQIRINRADLYPTVGVAPFVGAERESANQPFLSSAAQSLIGNGAGNFLVPAQVSWEIDLFGRIRRNINIAREETAASSADLANVRLSLEAELATDYFELRAADAQRRLLDQTVAQYQDAVRVTNNRFVGGISAKSDLTQAETQLQAAKVLAADIQVARAQFEHAIAVLVGKPPAELAIAPVPLATAPPEIPAGLPSELLERRPDIAAAERRTAEANQRIGIARAAFFPSLGLSGDIGFQGTSAANIFGGSSLVYAVGPTLAQTLYDAGRRQGIQQQTFDQYNNVVANYRQTSLTAFQQVEDSLSSLRILADEANQQHAAVTAAQESERIFNNRYVGGIDTYLQVITAQTLALNNERNEIDIMRRRMDQSVLLIKALGGGFTTAQLPKS